MADRFFLVCVDDEAPLIEIVGVASTHEFMKLITKVGEDPDLVSLAWGVVVSDDVPDDARSVSVRDIGYVVSQVLMRRLLQHVRPQVFAFCDDPENLRAFLRRTWEV